MKDKKLLPGIEARIVHIQPIECTDSVIKWQNHNKKRHMDNTQHGPSCKDRKIICTFMKHVIFIVLEHPSLVPTVSHANPIHSLRSILILCYHIRSAYQEVSFLQFFELNSAQNIHLSHACYTPILSPWFYRPMIFMLMNTDRTFSSSRLLHNGLSFPVSPLPFSKQQPICHFCAVGSNGLHCLQHCLPWQPD
jgi:hypothetical protein